MNFPWDHTFITAEAPAASRTVRAVRSLSLFALDRELTRLLEKRRCVLAPIAENAGDVSESPRVFAEHQRAGAPRIAELLAERPHVRDGPGRIQFDDPDINRVLESLVAKDTVEVRLV